MSGGVRTRRPRVLLVAAGATTTGGGERHVADLLEHLPRAGFDVALLCPGGGDLGDLARGLGAPVCTVPIDRGFSAARVRAVRAAIVAADPDIVHAHGSRAAAFARLADPRARRRVVYTVHGIHVDKPKTAARRIALTSVERLLRPCTARFVTVCASDATRGVRLGILGADRTTTIHNGVELPREAPPRGRLRAELGVAPDVPIVLSAGRLEEPKDQSTLLRAWRVVSASHPDALLVIVGSGSLESRLRSEIAAHAAARSIRLIGPRATLAEAYEDSDVFALSSRWEGLPYVVLEAMSHGLPIAGTNVDGMPEAVVDEVSGLLVPPQEPTALGKAIERLVADPELRGRLGAAGRERVGVEFTLERMIARVARVYRELTGPRSPT